MNGIKKYTISDMNKIAREEGGEGMKKMILALILVLALFSGINPNITARDHDKNHDDHDKKYHDDDDHGGCLFIFDD